MVPKSKTGTLGQVLYFQDVQSSGDTTVINVRCSKTNQVGKGARIALGPGSDKENCPVDALLAYFPQRGEHMGYLFYHVDGSLLTKHQFWAITCRALDRIGLSGIKLSTHFFHIGVASIAAVTGYGSLQIQLIGRWYSRAFHSYDCAVNFM